MESRGVQSVRESRRGGLRSVGGGGQGRAEPCSPCFPGSQGGFLSVLHRKFADSGLEFQVGGWGCGSQIERLSRVWERPGFHLQTCTSSSLKEVMESSRWLSAVGLSCKPSPDCAPALKPSPRPEAYKQAHHTLLSPTQGLSVLFCSAFGYSHYWEALKQGAVWYVSETPTRPREQRPIAWVT